MSPTPESEEARVAQEAPGWEAVTAFVEWDQTLPRGTQLRDYEVRGVIGESAFGIVYVGWDHALRRQVAIKEYLPRTLAARVHGSRDIAPRKGASEAAFGVGLKGFVAEARMLARFDQAALVKVYRFWEENGTAYRVMPLCEGPTLEQVLSERTQNEAEVRTWLRPLLDVVSVMHAAHCFHHHIAADNIVLTPSGPVLLDFAAARRLVGSLEAGPASVVKAGYAPIEQYGEAATLVPGPWTDLYSLAAIAYRAITGKPPPPAPERLADDRMKALSEVASDRCSVGFAEAIGVALSVRPESRPRNDAELRELMGGIEAPLPAVAIGATRDLMAEPFAPESLGPREITVPIPTQPQPLARTEEPNPMDVRFASSTPAATEAMPFKREEFALGRNARIALAVGICVLGAVAVVGLRTYADRRPAAVADGAVAGASASAALIGAPLLPPALAGASLPAALTPAPARAVSSAPVPAPSIALPAVKPEPAPAAAPARSIAVDTASTNESDRRSRCADLLQEATLRQLSAAEAAFFKKECR